MFESIPQKEFGDKNIKWSDLTEDEYAEAMGGQNKYFAEKQLGHEPSDIEALNHFVGHSDVLHRRIKEKKEKGEPDTIKLPQKLPNQDDIKHAA